MNDKNSEKVNVSDAINTLIMYYNKRRFFKVIGLYENIFKKSGLDEIGLKTREIVSEVYLAAAYSYVELGSYNKALEILNSLDLQYLKESLDKSAYNVVPLSFHQIYMYTNNFEKALEYAEELIELNPKLSTNYLRRGFAYNNLKKFEEAEKDFIRALENDGQNDFQIYNNLILLYMETNKFSEALNYIEKASIRFIETKVEFLLMYMKIAVLIKLGDFENVSKVVEDIYDKVPDNQPELKIALIRIEGKNYSEVYDIMYEQIQKITQDPREQG